MAIGQTDLFSVQSEQQEQINSKKIELGELKNSLLSYFSCQDVSAFFEKLKIAYENNDKEFYKRLSKVVGNLQEDWLQKIYQYYSADREKLKQDYTPKTLAQLTARLAIREDGLKVLDCCCGSGALTIQAFQIFGKSQFELLEIDSNVLPVLNANLEMREIRHQIKHYDVINDCNIEGDVEDSAFVCDYCISNPPFNLKWKHPLFASSLPRFSLCVPPEQNANYTFVLTAMAHTSKVGAFILPKGVTSSDPEREVRKALVCANLVEAVVSCPGKMFESTDIPTVILVLNHDKKTRKTCFVKLDDVCSQEEREQAGQFGGSSHENRIYKKIFNVITDDLQERVCKSVFEMVDSVGFAKCVDVDVIKSNGFDLSPSKYVDENICENKVERRSYETIVNDLNSITREKNRFKITINENAARCLGNNFFMALSQIERSNEGLKIISETLKGKCGTAKIELSNNIKISKDKNIIRIEQNPDDDKVSHLMINIMNDWANHYRYLNGLENQILAELRDKLMEDLMNSSTCFV